MPIRARSLWLRFQVVAAENQKIHELWNDLKEMLKERDDRLNYSSELQRFLQDLDHFQLWLHRIQTDVASEDIPNNLQVGAIDVM